MMSTLPSDLWTCVPEIDTQHRELFICLNDLERMAESLRDVTENEIEQVIYFLEAYLVKHFDDEEELQREYNYPQRKWHQDMHRWYITEFHKMQAEYAANGPSTELMHRLAVSVRNWIVKHIVTADVKLGQYINQQKHSQQP